MFSAGDSPFLVAPEVPFDASARATSPHDGGPGKKELKKQLAKVVERLAELQHILYAHDHHALLLVFQALDAAGKDSTIRAVLSGVDPAGCQVYSFKAPTPEELDHDFLWRCAVRLPERGRIGVFNRSYYEEVLVVRVHPEFLEGQKIPADCLDRESVWRERFESIVEFERHLARNGTVILKFWLNVSKEEQRQRFLSRLDEPEKHWKFSENDVEERRHWDAYQRAYAEMLPATSRPWAPWYAIPADDKPFMRVTVAEIVAETLESLDLRYPQVTDLERRRFEQMRDRLEET
ncbi:MAG TPA: polyphosphate kinase 2 family protein [Thermoanaerobaculia bacterium]|nr:polyphosphate kinase 2 family protein [Thermoanaerobaculia bacterium]